MAEPVEFGLGDEVPFDEVDPAVAGDGDVGEGDVPVDALRVQCAAPGLELVLGEESPFASNATTDSSSRSPSPLAFGLAVTAASDPCA